MATLLLYVYGGALNHCQFLEKSFITPLGIEKMILVYVNGMEAQAGWWKKMMLSVKIDDS